MSYQVGSACYDTAAAAAAASASSQVGSFVRQGEVSYVVNASSVDGTSITYSLAPVGGGSPVVVTSPYAAQPCGLLTASDAVDLSWLVVAVWAAVWAVKFIATAVHDWGNQHGHNT
ncbi:hypothetical protein [Variovorax boronicumulans]|uniref:hypothetical protein n=1 Tax=Variovorax boronicumulans TaxID=436515 RepID=UPI0012FE4E97|nr:hypothetical protein [Variovorax boronicumulans]